MIFKHFVAGQLAVNSYLLIDEKSKKAILIDCPEFSSQMVNALKEYDATLEYVLLTHGHFDHILGVNDLKKYFPETKILVNKNDVDLMENIGTFMADFGMGNAQPVKHDESVEDGDEIKFGENFIKVISTAGHSKGSVCYKIEDKLFCGDTVFLESVGRTDLYGGDFPTLKSSINDKIFKLPDETVIYPGHGPQTSVGHEKKYNEFI